MTTTASIAGQEPSTHLLLLNHYRVTEMHSVSAIMRMARLADSASLRTDLSRQMRDEATHSWLWTRVIREEADGKIIGVKTPYHHRLGFHYGIPRTLTELLALAWVSRKHSVAEYAEQMDAPNVSLAMQRMLRGILRDEERHVRHLHGELALRMREDRHVQDIIDRALAADQRSAADIASDAQPSASQLVGRGSLVLN
jgi:hypothetical protein